MLYSDGQDRQNWPIKNSDTDTTIVDYDTLFYFFLIVGLMALRDFFIHF